MAQTLRHSSLVGGGSLGLRLSPTVHPLHHAVGGLMLGTGLYLASPLVVPVVQFTAGSATGLVPMFGEALGFMISRGWISLGPAATAGIAVGGVVGVVNIIVHREQIGAFAKDKYDWILRNADPTPSMNWGSHRPKSQSGDGPTSLSQRTRKSPRIGKRRRRCKFRNRKSGKTCLRPRGHSGRHRYR